MPYPNYYSARIIDPKLFTKHRYDKNKFGEGVDAVWGIKDNKASLQSIRFAKTKFTKAVAKAWLRKHNYKATIEEDAGPPSTIMGPANYTTSTSDIAQFADKVGPVVSRQGDRKKKKKKDKSLKDIMESITNGVR